MNAMDAVRKIIVRFHQLLKVILSYSPFFPYCFSFLLTLIVTFAFLYCLLFYCVLHVVAFFFNDYVSSALITFDCEVCIYLFSTSIMMYFVLSCSFFVCILQVIYIFWIFASTYALIRIITSGSPKIQCKKKIHKN